MEEVDEIVQDRVILVYSFLLCTLAIGFLIAIAQAELHPFFSI